MAAALPATSLIVNDTPTFKASDAEFLPPNTVKSKAPATAVISGTSMATTVTLDGRKAPAASLPTALPSMRAVVSERTVFTVAEPAPVKFTPLVPASRPATPNA